ncbi:Sugar phosphate permease [Saccharopolyspora antimicrobica]|uniref:Sugar phosphate permease n=1 Tax=Saccharopolyspora antimicrobica TaxID=455193 RepID=A0A1I5C7H9_9PSEU|nr:MFS transporter [Saccharopolyspora antimicrobica]RKT88942.1 sugar phosphate permease [Saccharopolyspora antimicrobica]SFN83020.1 Sugar phosphate permease [Saccharopolyspora antimicrobica]
MIPADRSERATNPDEAPVARGVALAKRKLIPVLVLMYVISYVDRLNLSYAEPSISRTLELSATAFGVAAGAFFLGYAILEVPSNLILYRVGARKWLARIMITWGAVSMLSALSWDATSLIVFRVLLGIAEAGFVPGVLFLVTRWFPERDRGRATALLFSAPLIAGMLGGPLAGVLLSLDGLAGLHGWQWLFLVEGFPAVLIGLWVIRKLPNHPGEAKWLDDDAAQALQATVDAEGAVVQGREKISLGKALLDHRVLLLAAIFVCYNLVTNGVTFWLAAIVGQIGHLSAALSSALITFPILVAAIGLLVFGRLAGRTKRSRGLLLIGLLIGIVGLTAAAVLPPELSLVAVAAASFGASGLLPVFWELPARLLTGQAAAGGIALINSIGQLGGLVGPTIVGAVKESTGSLGPAFLMLAGVLAFAALLTLFVRLQSSGSEPVSAVRTETS